jgi:hypothetical protein
MSIREGFMAGGFWMYVLTVFAAVLVGLITYQVVHRHRNIVPIIWASQLAVLCCGFLGTTIGITQMGLAIGDGTAKIAPMGDVQYPAAAALAKGLAVAMTPGSYALIIVFICAIATGIVQCRVRAQE